MEFNRIKPFSPVTFDGLKKACADLEPLLREHEGERFMRLWQDNSVLGFFQNPLLEPPYIKSSRK